MPDLEARFNELHEIWNRDTAHMSNVSVIISHPSYREIVAMGWDVLPIIIDRLRTDPDHWFCALVEITGEDHAVGETTMGGAARRWVEWYDGLTEIPIKEAPALRRGEEVKPA